MVGKSGQQISAENVVKFDRWVSERETAVDWKDYIRVDQLNRKEIAVECGFSESVPRQNPAIKARLEALEARLRAAGIIASANPLRIDSNSHDASNKDFEEQVLSRRVVRVVTKAQDRVKALEEKNASLIAEVTELRRELKKFKLWEEHLVETGRVLRP